MNNIFKLRKKLNLDQKTLSKKTGLSRSYLGALENGTRRLNEDNMQKISHALGVNPEDLIKQDNDNNLDFLYDLYKNNIKKYRLKRGLNQKDLAAKIGKSRALVAGIENGKINPTQKNLEALAIALNVSINDLITTENIDNNNVGVANIVIYIPMYNHKLSAGRGIFTSEEENCKQVQVLKSMLEEMHIISPKNLIAFKICGNSMEPTLKENDTAFLDKSINYINGEGIYAFTYSNNSKSHEFYIKRMQKINEKLHIVSDNKQYEEWEIDLPNDNINIIGKFKFSMKLTKLD